MASSKLFTVRPHPQSQKTKSGSAVLYVYVSASALVLQGLKHGQFCKLVRPDLPAIDAKILSSPDSISDNIVQVSRTLQDHHKLRLQDKVSIIRGLQAAPCAKQLRFTESVVDGALQGITEHDARHWEWMIGKTLKSGDLLYTGMALEVCLESRQFVLESMLDDSSDAGFGISVFNPSKTDVKILPRYVDECATLKVEGHQLIGLEEQVKMLNSSLQHFTNSLLRTNVVCILIHGASGTGRSTILAELAKTRWGSVIHIEPSANTSTASVISRGFEDALQQSRSIILMDDFEDFGTRPDNFERDTRRKFEKGLRSYESSSNKLVLVATAQNFLDIDLRFRNLFWEAIWLPPPGPNARSDILKSLLGLPLNLPDAFCESVGGTAYGYTARELRRIVVKSNSKAQSNRSRATKSSALDRENLDEGDDHKTLDETLKAAIEENLKVSLPSLLQETIAEKPNVLWQDVGGHTKIRKDLEFAFKRSPAMARAARSVGLPLTKGLLLYGPPGCSKTLSVKAFANESGFNLITVQGPELLSMYVGESERAVRRIFQNAKSAQPCILFIDEIDALAQSRNRQGSSGLQVLPTLLTEMDGFKSLGEVFVIAATNRPEVLDNALLRPGRFDKKIYLGLPDEDGRAEILSLRFKTMKVLKSLDLDVLVRETDGYTPAEITDICNRVAEIVLRESDETSEVREARMADFLEVCKEVSKGVSNDELARLKSWKP